MNNIIISTIMSVVSALLVYELKKIFTLLEKNKNYENSLVNGVVNLLRIQIIEYHNKYMREGDIPLYVYENFDQLYESYITLGGNGTVVKLKNEMDSLRMRGGCKK